jgi:hypothetical protein
LRNFEQCRDHVAILHVGRGDREVDREALRIDADMSLLAFDFLAGVVPTRIDVGPPFSAPLTLWLSTMPRLALKTSKGYDIPPYAKFKTFDTWAEVGPPKGTLYHYPDPHADQILAVSGMPTPHHIAEPMYYQGIFTKMVVRHAQGEAMEKTLAWAESEVEGFMR